MSDEELGMASNASLQSVMAQRQLASGYVRQLDPEREAELKAERAAEMAQYQAERATERDERYRTTALQLAAAVCAQGQSDPDLVLATARDFHAFLNGADRKPN